ncbi:MAG: BspA family leucine-rich repeat surface protein, partial [Eggerthellaceae bacterium]|nr:BspA family leucine-rich repeat surface protein [Eggerthellaceae bacterium]
YCKNLKSVDFSTLNLSNVTSMQYLFQYCAALESVDFSTLNLSNVTSMQGLFQYCAALKSVDFSTLNLSNVTNMGQLFRNCSALESVEFGSSTENAIVSNLNNAFQNCGSIKKLDLSTLHTGQGASISSFIGGCNDLEELDIRNLSLRDVPYAAVYDLWDGKDKLWKITIGPEFFAGTFSPMFPYSPIDLATLRWRSEGDPTR